MNNHYLIKNAKVLDLENENFVEASIEVEGGRIVELHNPDFEFPHVVDFKGKYVIPGLIDMHVHIKDGHAPYFLAAGVTTVRNTGGNVCELKGLINAPTEAPTPRVYSADRMIDGPPGLWGATSPWNMNTTDPEIARKEVRRQAEAGANLIKVYGLLPSHVMNQVVDEANKLGLEVSCDLIHSSDVNAVEAARIGVTWNEHASGVIQAMYSEWTMGADDSVWENVPFDVPDEEKIREVCQVWLDHGVKLCPTMVLFDQMDRQRNVWKADDFLTSEIEKEEQLMAQWKAISQHEKALKRLGIQSKMNRTIARVYKEMGGVVVAGTDTPAGIYSWPGLALHRELELFVRSGFTEIEALRAATSIASESIGLSDLGDIRAGKIADLVILDKNPLEDIRHTKEIHWVIKGGKILTQKEILENLPDQGSIMANLHRFIDEFHDEVSEDWYDDIKQELNEG
ncbi:imidazolonepropionase [Halalkalibacillus sediminis]|uniref:Imidazolonepropionase n=1 Tax=Halalkalibacillus sediminis TaxID=2018042 RepID=A0A2I0QQT5_9BACI|nr:amidohydrolase family protein [Halalkalibacillus sediminis]PKR76697.1 imidazolonepropionase [Halalkalibacillus sediminis]